MMKRLAIIALGFVLGFMLHRTFLLAWQSSGRVWRAIQWNAAFNANDPQGAVTILERLPEQAMERQYVLPVARLLAQGDQQAALAKVRELATGDLSGMPGLPCR